MRHCLLRAPILLMAISSLYSDFFIAVAFAAETVPKTANEEKIDLDYHRESLARSSVGRPSISRPAAGTLPQALVAVAPSEEPPPVKSPGDAAGLETRAAVAATWTVRQQVKIFGRREIYQAGFYDALQQAFQDPLIGDWDFRQGHRSGRRDRDAYRIGSELGLARARVRAFEDAWAQIRDPWNDDSRPAAADSGLAASTPLPPVHEPRLLDVFEDLPVASVLGGGGLDPLPDPIKLYRCDNYDDFYDHHWKGSEQAFDYWLDHHRDRAFWRQLNDQEKTRFARMFRATFSRQLPDVLADAGERAYAQGHGDGWSYGVQAVQEWRYRKGFHEGFTSALGEHARSTFDDRYPSLFDDRYGELFHGSVTGPAARRLVDVSAAPGAD